MPGLEELEMAAGHGDRCPQLVGHRGEQRRAGGDLGGDPLEHPVEGAGEVTDLVGPPARVGHPHREVADAGPLGRGVQRAQRPGRRPQREREDDDAEQAGERGGERDPAGERRRVVVDAAEPAVHLEDGDPPPVQADGRREHADVPYRRRPGDDPAGHAGRQPAAVPQLDHRRRAGRRREHRAAVHADRREVQRRCRAGSRGSPAAGARGRPGWCCRPAAPGHGRRTPRARVRAGRPARPCPGAGRAPTPARRSPRGPARGRARRRR